jgi:hypothetical protein
MSQRDFKLMVQAMRNQERLEIYQIRRPAAALAQTIDIDASTPRRGEPVEPRPPHHVLPVPFTPAVPMGLQQPHSEDAGGSVAEATEIRPAMVAGGPGGRGFACQIWGQTFVVSGEHIGAGNALRIVKLCLEHYKDGATWDKVIDLRDELLTMDHYTSWPGPQIKLNP